jgi:2-polyprenyl-3-methyl-5-hydroxy-6-metoxy-1,4-benzoquinol methylase
MDENTKIVHDHYEASVENEWGRIANRPEFLLTCRMLDRYIKPGDKVLDIGGGPGRYSLYLAQKGCEVTLLDLSPKNTAFAAEKATEMGLSIQTVAGDAREADTLVGGQYGHVLLMGPMYHLLEENDRVRAVSSATRLLSTGGLIYVSFINLFAGMIFYMKHMPDFAADDFSEAYIKCVIDGTGYGGPAFTKAYFTNQNEVLPFMAQFPLEKLHLFGQEGITSPCESSIMSQGQDVIDQWLDFSESVWEREEFLSYSEHLMYIGRKTG